MYIFLVSSAFCIRFDIYVTEIHLKKQIENQIQFEILGLDVFDIRFSVDLFRIWPV